VLPKRERPPYDVAATASYSPMRRTSSWLPGPAVSTPSRRTFSLSSPLATSCLVYLVVTFALLACRLAVHICGHSDGTGLNCVDVDANRWRHSTGLATSGAMLAGCRDCCDWLVF